ncbi:small nuclear ribonucleoprotein F, putative [Perkinsus marinus ATCC 50983]|uniref:Sm protein F n=1 Tax=Perkinsus marinus (strain ATCC 50983 / TXsc) TaxID=423536 RepID=C5LQP2_PERM5|nr:small nuclear ribonucleoprotein F, putative [Perkinsus marinus ATCC 50983]EER00777.1 small nuclear ribonucleoprotein F, putative [Perkinsus marinus ATCC 50983]|eukprot:XP_002768059.1 small nuclear ribonucleoprotein F, putative [Perkinsus marinus ATCC 50983]
MGRRGREVDLALLGRHLFLVMSVVPVNPQPFLNDLTGQEVLVRLKWATLELKGRLQSVDTFMNLRLDHCEEWQSGNFKGALGDVLIR